jgi:hypothetical protein
MVHHKFISTTRSLGYPGQSYSLKATGLHESQSQHVFLIYIELKILYLTKVKVTVQIFSQTITFLSINFYSIILKGVVFALAFLGEGKGERLIIIPS